MSSAAGVAAILLAALAGVAAPGAPADRLRRLRRAASRAGPTAADGSPRHQGRLSVRLVGVWLVCVRPPWLRRREAVRRGGAVIDVCSSLAAELSAGALPRAALVAALAGQVHFGSLAAVVRAPHGDVAAALRLAAGAPGGDGLGRLEAAWQVCERSGSGLSVAVSRLVETLRAEERVRHEVAAELAGPRATGVLLAVLPAAGVLMGTALGAAPLRVLLDTPVGRLCLLAGLALEALGLVWTARIARGAELT